MRPAQVLKIVPALLVVAVAFYQFAEVNGFFHKVTYAEKEETSNAHDGRRGFEAHLSS
jgi:hypothetical protein